MKTWTCLCIAAGASTLSYLLGRWRCRCSSGSPLSCTLSQTPKDEAEIARVQCYSARERNKTPPAPPAEVTTEQGPVLVKRFDHVAIEVSDVKASKEFYCGVLGFKIVDRPPFRSKGYWMMIPGLLLHMAENPDDRKKKEKSLQKYSREARGWEGLPVGDHFAFTCSGEIEDCEALLSTKAIPYKKVYQTGVSCAKQLFFFDPDGNAIEISSEVCLEFRHDPTVVTT